MQNPQASQPAIPPIGAASVLVIEDNDTTRHRMSGLLRQRGYTVTEATDGLDALRKVTAARFDAILLDLLLPHVDGWQFRATQLRHPELCVRPPTVIVTVQPLREPDRYALRADDIVRKPFEDADILKAVQRACDLPRARAVASTPIPQPAPATGTAYSLTVNSLFWSRRGEIACAGACADGGRAWLGRRTVAGASLRSGRRAQSSDRCQHCPGDVRPIHRSRRDLFPRPRARRSLGSTLRPCGTWRRRFYDCCCRARGGNHAASRSLEWTNNEEVPNA